MANNLTEQFIREHRTEDVRKLALASHPKDIDLQYALTQISGWQVAKSKLPLWADTDGIIPNTYRLSSAHHSTLHNTKHQL